MDIKVSVIVPVYNTEQYLEKCLNSLVCQTLSEIEIIVVNDGSKDNSQKIIDEFQSKYPCIKSFIKENGGLSDARNYGLSKAQGEYVAFVDSDDYVESDMFESMVTYADTHELNMVVCDTFMDYLDHSYVLKADLGYTEDPVKAYIIAYPNAPARLIKRDLMQMVQFRTGIWYEDLDLMPTVATLTSKIGFTNVASYHYLQREASLMHQEKFNPKFNDIFVALDDVLQRFKKEKMDQKYHDELEYLYISHLQRSAILRFSGISQAKPCLEKVKLVMKENFPHWKRNQYLKKSSWKFQLICWLGALRQYWIIAILKKIS